MADGKYIFSLLGFANLIEMILLLGSFVAICKASTRSAQYSKDVSQGFENNLSESNDVDSIFVYRVDVRTIKQVGQAILIIIFTLTLVSFLAHILFSFRYRYSWHQLSTTVAFLCIINVFFLFGISVFVSCWEDKLRKLLTESSITQDLTLNSLDSKRPQIGSAAAAATFGFAGCLLFLAEALIRFRRLADKIHL